MLVKAPPGLRCPKEDNPRTYITDAAAVDVPASAYYLQRVADGSLLETPSTALITAGKKGKEL